MSARPPTLSLAPQPGTGIVAVSTLGLIAVRKRRGLSELLLGDEPETDIEVRGGFADFDRLSRRRPDSARTGGPARGRNAALLRRTRAAVAGRRRFGASRAEQHHARPGQPAPCRSTASAGRGTGARSASGHLVAGAALARSRRAVALRWPRAARRFGRCAFGALPAGAGWPARRSARAAGVTGRRLGRC